MKAADVIVIDVPFAIRRRGGRKVIVSAGTHSHSLRLEPRNAMLSALGKAHRWKKQLEGGEHGSMAELARVEKVNDSYLCRVMRLNLLAPQIVEQILDGTFNADLHLQDILRPFPIEWQAQVKHFSAGARGGQ